MLARTRTLAALTGFALSLGAPAGAGAARVIAPPGNSGVGQYVEVVPTAGGGAPAGSHHDVQGQVLPASTLHRLAALGPDGKTVAAFAQSTGTPHGSTSPHRRSRSTRPKQPSSAASEPSPPSAGLRESSAGSVGGLGLGLPVALGAITLAAVGVSMTRRRRTSG